MKKKIVLITTVIILSLQLLTACTMPFPNMSALLFAALLSSDKDSNTEPDDTVAAEVLNENMSEWAIYWYLCGSDLETEHSAASADLSEMMKIDLPENVKIIIQTGGAKEWHDHGIDPDSSQRYLYSSDGFELLENNRNVNMGKSSSLEDFLTFCEENYPAKKKMFLFWNHGSGSVGGVAFDQNYYNDSLSLDEIYDAFDAVYELNTGSPPFEAVGFDACLMASYETAYTFWDISKYMIASEESEPGIGWNYTAWIGALSEEPSMNGKELGTIICDTYYEHCEEENLEYFVTLSVADLSQFEDLHSSFNNLGNEALILASESPSFVTQFGRNASKSENYGGNTPSAGYVNMVDMGHLVRNNQKILPNTSEKLLEALDKCIVYKVNGPYKSESTGMSCFYSLDGDIYTFKRFKKICPSDGFKYFYDYIMTGTLDSDGLAYLKEITGKSDSKSATLKYGSDFNLEGHPVSIRNGSGVLDIGSDAAGTLNSINYQLAYYDNDIILILGSDNAIDKDWTNGVFTENFYGDWLSIDGYICYKEIIFEGDDYDIYSVPILLNGEENNLRIALNHDTGTYEILGAVKGLEYIAESESEMADKNLRLLVPGDVIHTVHYAMAANDVNAELECLDIDRFVVTEDTKAYDVSIGDGSFLMAFEMKDFANNSYLSDFVMFEIDGDDIWVSEG